MLYSLESWGANFPDLERSFSVLAFDRIGQGYTDNPESAADYTFERVLRHIVLVLETCTDEPAHVVGHSRGGLFAARLAQDRPDLVKTLVICDSNSLAPADSAVPAGFYEQIESQVHSGYTTIEDVILEPTVQSFSADHIDEPFAQALLAVAGTRRNRQARAVMSEIKLSRWYPDVEAARDRALAEIDAEGLSVPTLLVWGRNDPSAPPVLGVKLMSRIAPRTESCALHILDRAGHYVFRERREAFNDLVRMHCR